MKPSWQRILCTVAIASGITFVLLTIFAMLLYPGGTLHNHAEPRYMFFSNPFSDLGRTHVFDGGSNFHSMLLFMTAMIAGAFGLGAFFTAFAGMARQTRSVRIMSSIGAVLGILAGISFVGVACTPWDLYMQAHIQFVFLAFRSLLIATLMDLLVVMIDRTFSKHMIGPFAIFLLFLGGYIALLTAGVSGGPGSGAVLQATGQKVIVYVAILTVTIQSAQLRQTSPDQAGV